MKKMKCRYNRKVVTVMKDFLAAASDLTYFDENGNELKQMPELHDGSRFGAIVDGYDYPTFTIVYSFSELMHTRSTKQFRKNFVDRCPKARGFADITLSLLHELGHFETEWYDFGDYDRETETEKLKDLPITQINQEYFKLPDEYAATEWAIEWLAKKENRILAKNFEREFFKCFSTLH